MDVLDEARLNFLLIDSNLCDYASKSGDALRIEKMEEDFRTPYFRDVDRIIHSLSYTRYLDKTQVYSFKSNDHVSKRIVHVQLVSKIARTIGRALRLNTDLIEAISLGHDIGHTPLGHMGESILNEISQKELGEYFSHNVQSMRCYMNIENNGLGLNLTIQTLDGILCHNGELELQEYRPQKKTKETFLEEYERTYTEKDFVKTLVPMTLEGCVVRVSDIIAYLGKDIEDARILGIIKEEDIPINIRQILGVKNREIVNTIIMDLIHNSFGKPYLKLSDDVFEAIKELKKFNYVNIYDKSLTEEEKNEITHRYETLFNVFLQDVKNDNRKSLIFKDFLNYKNEAYQKNTSNERKVIDFLAGMTDDYFGSCYEKVGI